MAEDRKQKNKKRGGLNNEFTPGGRRFGTERQKKFKNDPLKLEIRVYKRQVNAKILHTGIYLAVKMYDICNTKKFSNEN